MPTLQEEKRIRAAIQNYLKDSSPANFEKLKQLDFQKTEKL